MNDKITMVTAFFPISRTNWKGYERSDQKYLNYFKFWARIKNDLIVYTTPEFKQQIMDIRQNFGRNNTTIITIEDPLSIDHELYQSIKQVTQIKLSQDFRILPQNPESWNAQYNYIMLIKEWCVNDAIKREITSHTVAWIDFGFNHGGAYYTNPNDFNFEWNYSFSNKVHLFAVNQDDGLPIFEIIRRMNAYIQGGLIVAPTNLWNDLWNFMRQSMIELNHLGLMDDDQVLLLMFVRKYPELCELHPCVWFKQFEKYSNRSFSTISQKHSPFIKIKQKSHYHLQILRYQLKWTKILSQARLKD